MRLFEYMGKQLFIDFGIRVPRGMVCDTPKTAAQIAQRLGGPVMIKAQVLSGKRGKGGGIRLADGPKESKLAAEQLLQSTVQGFPVELLLIEEKLAIGQELYLSLIVDGVSKKPVLIASAQGGMDIENVPEEQIIRQPIDVELGLPTFLARDIVRRLKIVPSSPCGKALTQVVTALYRLFTAIDAELVEINPLAICGDTVYAADAKITVDDASLYRHAHIPTVSELTLGEQEASKLGLSYVDLDGEIGVMANGAGITMATLDMITYFGSKPANFLDIGGGANQEATRKGLELVLAKQPKAVFVNIFGGITRCDEVAQAIVGIRRQYGKSIPMVVRLAGTNQDAGRAILEKEAGIEVFDLMQTAAQRAVELAG